nr:lysozyme inhibitor LprI family protein [Jannaschia sp. Os4]
MPAEIARCAEIAWTESEGALDLAYGLAVTAAEVLDETRFLAGEADEVRAAALVEAGQADWLAHRDSHCAAESLLVSPGMEREAVGRLCLARLNEARVAQLAVFAAE